MRNPIIPAKETSRPRSDDALIFRTLTPDDEERMRRMFSRLSEKSIYHRFHTPYPGVPGWMVTHLSKVDRPGEESFVAVAGDEVVGHAMYVIEGIGEAEMAVVIEDRWQSRGVGKLLLFRLALDARRHGVETFTATVLGENRRMLGLFDSVFTKTEYVVAGGAYHVRVSLSALSPVSKLELLDAPFGASRRVEAAPDEVEKVA